MKVKIKDTIYNSEDEPVMLILTDKDRANIAKMLPECTMFCAYPDGLAEEVVDKFMGLI